MGCVFTLEGMKFSGVEDSELHIRGNLDTERLVTYQDFNVVSRTRATYTRLETIIQKTKQKSLLGKNKTTVDVQHIPVTELQSGNETRALGEQYINVNHVHRIATVDTLGQ